MIERGIGETRCARIVDGEIAEARILVDGVVRAGDILDARLKQAARPTIAEAGGEEYLMPSGAAGTTEGAALKIEVIREAIPGIEPWKRPLARLSGEAAERIPELSGDTVLLPASNDPLGAAGWSDLLDEARSGIVQFPGGELRLSPTPAMTLIDVDGYLPAAELAMAGARAAARTILRHDIGGSIGFDLPTVAGKADRQAIGERVDAILPKPFERTAVNGFGFLQIVRPRRRASLIELAQDRAPFEARALLRRAAFEPPGAKTLVAHPALVAVLQSHPEWIAQLARQVGGTVSLRSDPALPISGAHAESV